MICKVIFLGPLYSVDTFKGKIHWLIFITFKILLPICFIVTSDSQISTDFDYQVKTIYKVCSLSLINDRFKLLCNQLATGYLGTN